MAGTHRRLPAGTGLRRWFHRQAVLGRIDELDIGFLTLQRLTAKPLRTPSATPRSEWQTVTQRNIGRQYRTPRVLDQRTRLGRYPKPIRRLAVTDFGHADPVLLLTNRLVAARLGRRHEKAKARTLFRKFVRAAANVDIETERITVRFGRRANNPFLIAAGFGDTYQPIPCVGALFISARFGRRVGERRACFSVRE